MPRLTNACKTKSQRTMYP